MTAFEQRRIKKAKDVLCDAQTYTKWHLDRYGFHPYDLTVHTKKGQFLPFLIITGILFAAIMMIPDPPSKSKEDKKEE